jgi:AraC family transcriptional regulator, glycine betaine-responsive activator
MPELAPMPNPRPESTQVIGFLLVPQFSMIAFTSAIEPLRLANRAAGKPLYAWRLFSRDGGPVRASNGVEITVDGAYADARGVNAAIVCAGLDVQTFDHRELMAILRRLSSFGAAIGAVCTGTYVLAKAGLLDGYQSTIHWENYSGLISEFPRLNVSQELFEIDRKRFTCAGGTAAVDMMLSVIMRDHGHELASHVTDQLIHHRIREASERQRMDLRARLGVAHPKLLAVVALMEEHVEEPLSCPELAERAGLSTRQLERVFCKYLGHSPTKHYLSIRLEHARYLLQQTSMPILSVGLSCGFVSASHFSKSYNEYFGRTPSAERKGGQTAARALEGVPRADAV